MLFTLACSACFSEGATPSAPRRPAAGSEKVGASGVAERRGRRGDEEMGRRGEHQEMALRPAAPRWPATRGKAASGQRSAISSQLAVSLAGAVAHRATPSAPRRPAAARKGIFFWPFRGFAPPATHLAALRASGADWRRHPCSARRRPDGDGVDSVGERPVRRPVEV